ncbi:MAG: hypothetical protein IPL61_32320 [Myxococcales bacterium]|nr:hypothetical protein [Myxococcales bacterium]
MRGPSIVAIAVAVAACRPSASPPLAPAGTPEDDGVGILARLSGRLELSGADDEAGGGDEFVARDRFERGADYDPLAFAGYGYGGFGYGGFGYGGFGYGGGLAGALGSWSAPRPPSYQAGGVGDLGVIEGEVRWGASAGVAWPPGCALARVAVSGAPVVGAVVYLERIERGRLGFAQTPAVVTATGCGLAPTIQLVGPVPAVVTIESRLRAAVDLTASAVSDEVVPLDPGGRVELAVDRPGPLRLAAPGQAPAWLMGAAHPYHVLTDERGRFLLDAVPAGPYVLLTWSPPLATAVGVDGPTWSPPVTARRDVVVKAATTLTIATTLTP